MLKIVAAQSVLFSKEIFSSLGQVEIIPDTAISAHHLKKADVLIVRSKTRVDKTLLSGSAIQFVGTATAGIDHIDLAYLNENKIEFSHAAGSNANSVAEYVIAALLFVGHTKGIHLFNKTLGIIGAGHVGQQLAKKARALGMNVLLNDPPLQLHSHKEHWVALDDLLSQADIVSLHVPLVLAGDFPTYRLVDKSFLSKLKPDAILINTSRGEVVDEESLLLQLEQGKRGPVILDVWDNEPNINIPLLQQVSLGTPHIAGYSTDGRVQGSLMIYQQLCRFLNVLPVVGVEQLFPECQRHTLSITSPDLDLQESVHEIVKQTYDIECDHQALLALVDMPLTERGEYFKRLRRDYRKRWEFSHYPIEFVKEDDRIIKYLKGIDFL